MTSLIALLPLMFNLTALLLLILYKLSKKINSRKCVIYKLKLPSRDFSRPSKRQRYERAETGLPDSICSDGYSHFDCVFLPVVNKG
ncbi:MAG: hypothetical protein Q7J06_01805, partial [Bacteroidales bacterium]|nr:hypothetical protein [Bacteroidales bacterium]